MKKIFSLIPLALFSSSMSAHALLGGPFDNGDYGILMERGGYYQSSYSFKNGSGYAIWSADNLQGTLQNGQAATPNIGAGSLQTPGGQSNNANRTVIYYKGVTYFGSAFGEVDITSRTISGYGNASSEYTVAQAATQQQAGFFTQTNVSTFSSSTVTASGRSYVANVGWRGRITKTSPQLRFSGQGEMSIIAPNGKSAIASLAYEAYSALVLQIAGSIQTGTNFPAPNYPAAQLAIAEALGGTAGTAARPASSTFAPTIYAQATGAGGVAVDLNGNGVLNDDLVATSGTSINTAAVQAVPPTAGLSSFLDGTGPSASYDESENVKLKVTGYRRFF